MKYQKRIEYFISQYEEYCKDSNVDLGMPLRDWLIQFAKKMKGEAVAKQADNLFPFVHPDDLGKWYVGVYVDNKAFYCGCKTEVMAKEWAFCLNKMKETNYE